MKFLFILPGLFVLAIRLGGQTSGGRLEGCPDPMVIAKALAKIAQMRWRDVSVERVVAIWPTDLSGMSDPNLRIDLTESCATGGGCLASIWSEGRIIGNHNECGERFLFDVDRKESGSATKRLHGIEISYSARTRKEVVAVARAFAGAGGLPEPRIATIGRSPEQDREQEFQWDTASKLDFFSSEFHHELQKRRVVELSSLTMTFIHRGSVWTVAFSLSRRLLDFTR